MAGAMPLAQWLAADRSRWAVRYRAARARGRPWEPRCPRRTPSDTACEALSVSSGDGACIAGSAGDRRHPLLSRRPGARAAAGAGDARRASRRPRRKRATTASRARATPVDRPDGRWDWWLDRNAAEHWYVAADEGYVVYRHLAIENVPDAFRILVLDLVATTPRAFRALWGLFADARSVVPSVVFRSGPSEPLATLLDGPDMVVRRERQWMLRLVDAAAAAPRAAIVRTPARASRSTSTIPSVRGTRPMDTPHRKRHWAPEREATARSGSASALPRRCSAAGDDGEAARRLLEGGTVDERRA
jgi:hypothetical protein